MTPADKREAVLRAFPSASWASKVSKMSDNQILAIYLRLKSQNKL